jgi:Flp pilus assembly protein TadB
MIGFACAVALLLTLRPLARARRPLAHGVEARRPARRRPGLAVGGAAIVGLIAAGPLIAVVAVIVVLGARRWRSLRRRRSEVRHAATAAPDVVELLVAAVRAGMTPLHGLAAITTLADPVFHGSLSLVIQRQASGERFADSLGSLHPALQRLGHTLARAERYGEPIAPLLDQLAADARQERRRASETAARQLPVRLCVPLAVCTLPSFVLLTIVPLLVGAFSSLSGST